MIIKLLTKPRLKPKFVYNKIQCYFYSSDQLISIKNQTLLELQTYKDSIIPTKPLFELLKLITTKKIFIEPKESLQLIDIINPRLIDLFPTERQAILNTLFKHFLVQQDIPFSIENLLELHYIYMSNTILNKQSFNPVRISNEMMRRNLQTENFPIINGLILEQLCTQNKISLALEFLNNVLDKKFIDLKKIKLSDVNKLYEEVFEKIKAIHCTSQSDLTHLLNSLLTIKPRNDYVQKLVLDFIRPDEKTRFHLINSHLDNSEFKQAAEILSSNEFSPSSRSFLENILNFIPII